MEIRFKKWEKNFPPRKILVIRLQATGDVVACLPLIQDLREKLPDVTQIDLLVREETESIPSSIDLFNQIFVLKGGRNTRKQLLWFMFAWAKLFLRKYDVILDLQNNTLSKIARKSLGARCWTEFDRDSPFHACERYKQTINAIGITDVHLNFNYKFRNRNLGIQKLLDKGWNGRDQLVVLNPAGAFITRNWEKEKYVSFAKSYLQQIDPEAKFLALGLNKIAEKAEYFKTELGDQLFNLVGETTPAEAFSILQRISFMVSEDSALMHMAYLSGKPVVGLLGSTRNDWTDPQLPHTYCFHSADLPCGNCMLAECIHENIRCLSRVTPEMVLSETKKLLKLL